jgi:hypothetical protein
MLASTIVSMRGFSWSPYRFFDCAGRRRSSTTLASFHQGGALRNKGLRYPLDPPTVEEIIAVMRAAGDGGWHQAAGRDRRALACRASDQ